MVVTEWRIARFVGAEPFLKMGWAFLFVLRIKMLRLASSNVCAESGWTSKKASGGCSESV